jgi:hypothetical protein
MKSARVCAVIPGLYGEKKEKGEKMEEELKWFASFPKELRKFRGKHVTILKNRVVASGDNAIEVLGKARKKYPKNRPVLAFVPGEETLIL